MRRRGLPIATETRPAHSLEQKLADSGSFWKAILFPVLVGCVVVGVLETLKCNRQIPGAADVNATPRWPPAVRLYAADW